jgi:GTPase SAR1 family protein
VLFCLSEDCNARKWNLTDTAWGSPLGKEERVKKKEEIKLEKKFIEKIENDIADKEKISKKLAHSMLVGPNGSGKSSLMRHLLKKARIVVSSSTDVCENPAIVNIDLDNSATLYSVDLDTWEEVELDKSLVMQMNPVERVTKICKQTRPKSTRQIRHSTETTSSPILTTTNSVSQYADVEDQVNQVEALSAKPATDLSLMPRLPGSGIADMIKKAIDKHGGFKGFRKSFDGTRLYLRDTGGQVEFQEMISLLIFGPSIFLFVFRADRDFQSKFSIEYRVSDDKSINCYTSSITTEEALLQCLASVFAMDTPSKSRVKTHQPLVFIIGTHKDMLGSSPDEKLTALNKKLKSLIKDHGFEAIVQYADVSKDQVMFAVDNTSTSDEDFKPIRLSINRLISSRKEFTIEFPIAYLLFGLELQKSKGGILSFEECKGMAANYRIEGDEQVSQLLQFLHHRIGVIQYHDVDGLNHFIVKEPQILYKIATNVIVETFSCKALRTNEQEDFHFRGILTASVVENVLNSHDDKIRSEDFLRLLTHLRIITPFTTPEDQEKRYFIPCVLNHVPELTSKEEPLTDIMPLSVRFRCSHCPKGLFGVLITHLMTPALDAEHDLTFSLCPDKIYKDQVSFKVRSRYADEDELSLKLLPSHFEVKFFPSQCENRDIPIGKMCNNIRQIIETAILRSLDDLHYDKHKINHEVCFKCNSNTCSQLHCVKKGKDNYFKLVCGISQDNRLPLQARCWYNEGEKVRFSCEVCTISHSGECQFCNAHA